MATNPSTRSGDTRSEENKRIVREFYDLAFNRRRPDRAAATYIGPEYVQHNPMAGDGAQAFVEAIAAWIETMPDLRVDFKRFIVEGDLVTVHSHFRTAPDQRGLAVMDIFRLENGKIVEHWDVLQEVPKESANENTMF